MSQTGYLLVAFACVVVVIAGWLLIILAKHARIRRAAGRSDDSLRVDG